MIPDLTHVTLTSRGTHIEQAPRYSGVYRFYDAQENLLYVGKSVDIKARLQQHFLEARKPGRHQRIMQQVTSIDCTPTAGEVGALLMENAAIKAETPLYNRRQRRLRKLWTLQVRHASSGFLQPFATDFLPDAERTADSYGLFQSPRHIDSSLRRHARDHGLCLRMLGLDKGRGPCFQFQLGRCDGACAVEESSDDHNARLLSVLDRDRIAAWPFPGALALREVNSQPLPTQPSEQYHRVEHWAYLGSFESFLALQKTTVDSKQRYFDKDAYHLLLSALRKGRFTVLDAESGCELDNPLLIQGGYR